MWDSLSRVNPAVGIETMVFRVSSQQLVLSTLGCSSPTTADLLPPEFLYSASISVTISRPGLPSLLVLEIVLFRGAFRVCFEAFEILGLESRYNIENLLSRGAHSASISRPRGSTLLTDHYLFYTFTRHHVLFSEQYDGD